jgi:glycosyltransferase involved in cell wall biosynthesis
MSIPVSVIIVTKNEEKRLGACLEALSLGHFDDVWVVDSQSGDGTCAIAAQHGARVEDYVWNGKYPKKRGWCLEYLELAHDWVFFVDADEIVSF